MTSFKMTYIMQRILLQKRNIPYLVKQCKTYISIGKNIISKKSMIAGLEILWSAFVFRHAYLKKSFKLGKFVLNSYTMHFEKSRNSKLALNRY